MPPYDTLSPYSPPIDSLAAPVRTLCVYDTLFTPTDHAEPVPRKSLFTHHLLPVRHPREISIAPSGASGWYVGGIALSVFFVVLFLRSKQLRLVDLAQSLVSERTMVRVLREANLTRAVRQAVIAPVVLLPLSVVACWLMLSEGANVWMSLFTFLGVYAVACVGYYVRNGIVRFFGEAFRNEEAVHIYLTSNYVYHLAYGIAATVFVFFICFTGAVGKYFLYALAVILCILFVMRMVRGMQLILTHSKSPKLYLFYYLCTLEIVPVIVLISVAIF